MKFLVILLWLGSALGQGASSGKSQATGSATWVPASPVISTSADDNTYCGPGDVSLFPAFDGPAHLPIYCLYTGLDGTPSPGTVYTVGYSGGVLTPGTCTSDWNSTMILLGAAGTGGSVVKVAQGCVITCGTVTGCVLPRVHGDATHWTLVESVDPATGVPDIGFPAEGQRATPCDIGLASVPNYPVFSADCTARGGPRVRTFKITSASATTPAMTVFDTNSGTICLTAQEFPCTDHWRFQGMEATNKDIATRTSHKLVEFNGADHMIFDRGVLHGLNDPNFRVEIQGGVGINGTYIGVINSWIYDIVCANAPVGSTCIDSQGVAGGTGLFPQLAQKIVNNVIASAGEAWFWGGGSEGTNPTADNPYGVVSDIEVRRNHSLHPLSWFMSFLGVGQTAGTVPHWDTKNLGETKSTNRALWEANVSENSWTGFQSDQFGNAWLATPKNQNSKIAVATSGGVSATLTGSTSAGLFYLNCKIGAATCSSLGALQFTCELDPNAIPDWHGSFGGGATVGSCGAIVGFGCAAAGPGNGSQANCPGSYLKLCQSVGDSTHCAVTQGTAIFTGPFFHILAYVNADQVQVVENSTGVVGSTFTLYKRGLNPTATVRNLTIRYGIFRHTAVGIENSSATDDGGAEGLGIHNVSIHDNVGYDVDATFWTNLNSCCNSGWFVKMLSSTALPTTVPSDISIVHNTVTQTGWQFSVVAGLLAMFDNTCKNPVTAGVCTAGNTAAYFPRLTVRDNITAAATHLINNSGVFATNTLDFGLKTYGCTDHVGVTGCDYNVQKNLTLTGLWTGQTNQIPNINLLGSNTVEACACTVAGTCTANVWSSPVGTGSVDACDRAASYATVFSHYDPTNWLSTDLSLPLGSPYLGKASDSRDLGADTVSVLAKTLGVANGYIFPTLSILGGSGTTSITVPGTAMPWNPADPSNSYFVSTAGTAGVLIPATPGQVLTLTYTGGLVGTPTPLKNGLGQGTGTTGGIQPWPSDRLPGGFSTGSAGEACGAFINGSGTVLQTVRIDNGGTFTAPAGTVNLSVGVNDNHSFADNAGSWTFAYNSNIVLTSGTNGVPYSTTVLASTGASPFKLWTILSGTLPSGLTLTKGTGVISGTPTVSGTFDFTLQVEDAGHQLAAQAFRLLIA